MIVVADTGPIHYLVLIGAVDVLKPLYGRVLVPQTVVEELKHAGGAGGRPDVERAATGVAGEAGPCLPTRQWPSSIPGERAAIALALSLDVERLLIDEWDGRAEAERRHLLVTGTLGVLADAHLAGLVDFEAALARLQQTNFYLSGELVDRVRRRLSTGRRGA